MALRARHEPTGATTPRHGWLAWWPVYLGLLALYLPSYVDMARQLWGAEEYVHEPMVLAVSLWLAGRALADSGCAADDEPWPAAGLALLIPGLALYAVGRSQSVWLLEAGSQIPVVGGAILATAGPRTLRAVRFALLFLLFMVPLPGVVVDALTGPLKQSVSEVAEQLLYLAGLPIARHGVMLSIGQYQLLVADACSGLHSMFSLAAMGLLYAHLMAYRNRWHNGLMIASILPIAYATNIVRVVLLVLVTYWFGDAAGQGFAHRFAGMALFATALAAFFAVDSAARWIIVRRLRQPL